jgi:hypothetical protein
MIWFVMHEDLVENEEFQLVYQHSYINQHKK